MKNMSIDLKLLDYTITLSTNFEDIIGQKCRAK